MVPRNLNRESLVICFFSFLFCFVIFSPFFWLKGKREDFWRLALPPDCNGHFIKDTLASSHSPKCNLWLSSHSKCANECVCASLLHFIPAVKCVSLMKCSLTVWGQQGEHKKCPDYESKCNYRCISDLQYILWGESLKRAAEATSWSKEST